MVIEIHLDDPSPPAGTIIVPGRPPARFVGWLGLLGILSDLAPARSAEATDNLGGELDAGGDAELLEHVPEVRLDGTPRDE